MSPAKKKAEAGVVASPATAALRRDAEMMRLARVLGVSAKQLDFLRDADETALRELRIAVSDHLYEISRGGLRRAASLATKVPPPVAAKVAEHALGPVLSGRMVSLLSAETVETIADRLSPQFLADTAVHLDLRRCGPLIGAISTRKLEQAGAELAHRREHVVLAAFVGYMDEAVLTDLLRVFDAETLLRAGFLVEEPERIDALVGHLSDEQIVGLHHAAAEHDLWEAALVMFGELGPRQRVRFAEAIEDAGDDHLDSFAAELRDDEKLRKAAGPLLATTTPTVRARLEQD